MESQSLHCVKLDRFRTALRTLPTTLPSGSSIYNFKNWSPDPERLDLLGTPCGVLNADLELVFGLRAIAPINLKERGPGIESLVDVFSHYLLGDFTEKPLLLKWLEDLTNTAEEISQHCTELTKRVPKPSTALKRSRHYVQDERNESLARKQQKTAAADRITEKSTKIAQTAQRCIWRFGFEDLEDFDSGPKLYTTGRRGYAVIPKLIVECRSKTTRETRWRCSAKGCHESWASKQPTRLLNHTIEECLNIDPQLKEEASEQSDQLALGSMVSRLAPKPPNTRPTLGAHSNKSIQPSVASIVTSEGRKAKQARFDLSVVNYLAAGQLPPRSVDLPEFHTMISEASSDLRRKRSSHIASSQIPMESSRLRRLAVSELRKCEHLTISFDGGTAVCAVGFTTIHVTTPDTRVAYWMKAVEALGVSHTGKYYFEELEKCLSLVRKVAGFFSKSTFVATHLRSLCAWLSITQGIQKAGKTRFAGWYYSAVSVQHCLPAIERLVEDGIVEIKKDHKLSFVKNVVILGWFKTQLHQFIKVTEPFAKALKCLESGHSNASNVFVFNLAIMASLRLLFDDNDSGLGLLQVVVDDVQEIASSRYFDMVLASGREAYVAAFILDPRYVNSTILCRNNLNPLDPGKIVLRPPTVATTGDCDLRHVIPCFDKVGIFMKKTLCQEIKAGTIAAARDYATQRKCEKLQGAP